MEPYNFKDKIRTYIKTNPFLSHGDLGVLLIIDNLYQEIPNDIAELRKVNTYFDPKHIDSTDSDLLTFLRLVGSNLPKNELKYHISKYLDMKYSCRGYSNTFEENMAQFKSDSKIASKFLENILEIANLPSEIIQELKETHNIQDKDLFELVLTYKSLTSKRDKYEIIRKLAIIDILTRIRKNYLIDDLDYAVKEILKVFAKGLQVKKTKPKPYYFWIDESEKIKYSKSKTDAKLKHITSSIEREKRALAYYPVQIFEGKPAITGKGNKILFMDVRNKLRRNGELYYTSTLEKIIRKNLEFPTQIHDILGIKIVVENQEDILGIIEELETFIGGASLRKKEKNSTQRAIHKFGRKPISRYSSDNYYVWKAVYDIALKSSIIPELKRICNLTYDKATKEIVKEKIDHYMKQPVNYIVEVQVQDLESYLLSIAEGSHADHSKLKMKQIRTNSFYKIFPKEIYEKELLDLRNKILQSDK